MTSSHVQLHVYGAEHGGCTVCQSILKLSHNCYNQLDLGLWPLSHSKMESVESRWSRTPCSSSQRPWRRLEEEWQKIIKKVRMSHVQTLVSLSWKTWPHLKNLFLSLSLRTQTERPFFFRSPRLLRSRLCLSSKSEQNEPQRLCFLTPDLTEKEQSERQWEWLWHHDLTVYTNIMCLL